MKNAWQTLVHFGQQRPVAAAFWGLLIIHLLLAALFPVIQDEAYYFLWARFPDLGYFDHPPMVAWLSYLTNVVPGSPLLARMGSVVLITALFPIFSRLMAVAGVSTKNSLVAGLLCLYTSIAGLVLGFISTPDVPLVFFWTLALHEAAYALKGQPARWLTAGLVTGLGIWGKYAMLLIGPVFLWPMLRRPKMLRTPWPYLGGLVCLLTITPHLWWNYKNDWVPFRFQAAHGLMDSHEIDQATHLKLSRPQPAMEGTYEAYLGKFFLQPEDLKKREIPKTPMTRFAQRVGDFLGGQLLLWGALLIPLIAGLWRYFRDEEHPWLKTFDPEVRPLLDAALLFPLLLFGMVAFSQHVEANWGAIHMVSASVFVSVLVQERMKMLLKAALFNVALFALLCLHAYVPLPLGKPSKDRILAETHGFAQLAEKVAAIDGIVLADTYQTVSMIKYYRPDVKITQWPGITRLSELTRRPEMIDTDVEKLKEARRYWLVSNQVIPHRLPGFHPLSHYELRDCWHDTMKVTKSQSQTQFAPPCKPVHRWFLTEYDVLDSHDEAEEMVHEVPMSKEPQAPQVPPPLTPEGEGT